MLALVTNLLANRTIRSIAIQVFTAFALAAGVTFIAYNTAINLEARGLASGFDFLSQPALYDINQRLIHYTSESTHGRALVVGLLNTLLVAVLGIILATIIGFVLGVLSLSPNWLASRAVYCMVEFFRNVPVLLHILLWHGIILGLPKVRDTLVLGGGTYLNNRGLFLPRPEFEAGASWVFFAFVLAIILSFILVRWNKRRQVLTGQIFPAYWASLGIIIVLPLFVFMVTGGPINLIAPEASRFNIKGGIQISPELAALTWALAIYTGAFISEIVRAGIQSVSKGQTEASLSLGVSSGRTMRLVIIPQALRLIIPPLTSQYLNLTKNSSLAIAIGYVDLVGTIGGITLNQTGQAIECLFITMMIYLMISLIISMGMNIYNRRMALVER